MHQKNRFRLCTQTNGWNLEQTGPCSPKWHQGLIIFCIYTNSLVFCHLKLFGFKFVNFSIKYVEKKTVQNFTSHPLLF